MATATKKAPRTGKIKVRTTEPKVKKADRAASLAKSQVRTKTDIDFVKAVRGR